MSARTRIACIMMAVVLATSMSAVFAAASAGQSNANALDKLEPELRTQVMEALAGPSTATFDTIVFLDGSADVASSSKAMSKAGATVKERFDSLGALSVEMGGSSALAVAGLDQVTHVFLDEYKYRLLDAGSEALAAKANAMSADATVEAEEIWWASTSELMGAEDVWAQGVDGAGVLVAVLDTGCDITQTDLADAVVDYKSFTSEAFHDVDGHGTATAGLVGSRGINEYDFMDAYGVVMKMKGMAPGASLMTGKVLDDTGYGWDSWIIGGINWAIDGGADIISMSLGGLEVPNDGNDPTSYALDVAANEHGIVCFLSAGNEGAGQSTIGASGVSKTVITVGATTLNKECQLVKYWPLSNYDETELIVKEGEAGYEDDHMIWWSSHGPTADGRIDPDISAAGAWGPSTQPGDTLMIQFGGTSMAAPVAAGIGALIIQAYTAENGVAPTPEQVKAIMMGTALDTGYTPNEQGPGRVDALAAYEAVMAGWEGPGHASLALTVPMGGSETVEFATGTVLGSKAIVPSDEPGIYAYEEVCPVGVDLFYPFDVPEGISYITVDLAFDQSYLFKKDVYSLTKPSGFTDTHINLIVYRLDENSERTMLNYAYSHTNTQELSVKVTPGSYELRVSPVIYSAPSVPFDYSIEFYETVDWSWFSADGSAATISVPSDATAGAHTAFIEAECEGVHSLVPVAVSVPIEFGVPVEDVNDVGHEVYGYTEGDWKYYYVEVPEEDTPAALTSVLDWESEYTDIDTYWINPATKVVKASLTDFLGAGIFGPWETSSMETSDVLTVLDPEPGMWMFALHNVMMDRVLEEPFTLTVYPYSAVEFGSDGATAKPGKPATISLANNVDQTVGVGLMAVTNTLVTTTVEYSDKVSSIDENGAGAVEILFDVAPLTQSLTLTIEWVDEAADLDVVIYAADWSNSGILWESGDSVTIDDPVSGEWDAAVALKNSASKVAFVLTVVTTSYEVWSSLSLSATEVWLGAGETVDITASLKGPMSAPTGMILAFDLMTGCEYDTIVISGRA